MTDPSTSLADLTPLDRFVYTLGCFFTAWGLFTLFISGVFLYFLTDELSYGLQDEPNVIEQHSQLQKIKHNDYIQMNFTLDLTHSMSFETVGGDKFIISPVMGANNQVLVYEEYHGARPKIIQEVKGRAVAADFSGEWNLDGHNLNLIDEFGDKQIQIPADAIVVVHGQTPRLHWWPLILFLGCLSLWVWFILRTVRGIQVAVTGRKIKGGPNDNE